MGRGSVASFFNFIDRQNNAIAARDAKENPDTGVGVDRHQVERMEKHREERMAKGYIAGAKPRSKHQRGRIVRGHMENPGADR